MIPGRTVPDRLLQHSELDTALASLAGAGRWYVGFSGGLDSTVLLHLLKRWHSEHPGAPELSAIHVNHQIQDEALEWQEHCHWVCRLLQLPFISRAVDVRAEGRGLEAAAREARYRVFEAELKAGDVLFLAHHADDQVETFFLRLLRGAGVQGLAGMAAKRTLGAGRLARPLLDIPRERLEAYARHHNLSWTDDPSNLDSNLDRNFLRQEVLPLLASRWPGYRRTVARASEHMAGMVRLLDEELSLPPTVQTVMGDPGLALEGLVGADADVAALNLRNWLRGLGLAAPDRSLLEEFLRQLKEAGEGASPELNCGDYTLRRYQQGVYLLPEDAWRQPDKPLPLGPGDVQEVPGLGRLSLEPAEGEGFVLESGEAPELAWRQGGERCRPAGRSGGKSLKKLLQEAAVPPWWRERIPLLYLGDELLAVGDLWLCESSRFAQGAPGGKTLWKLCWQRNIRPAFD